MSKLSKGANNCGADLQAEDHHHHSFRAGRGSCLYDRVSIKIAQDRVMLVLKGPTAGVKRVAGYEGVF